MLGKYTAPDVRDKIYKEADAIKERQSELTEQDLNLAGSRGKDANGKGGMKLFPHQAEALVALKAHPKIAILDIAPGGGKCGTYDMLVPTSTGLIKLGEAYETLSTGPADAHGFKPFRTRVMSHVGKAWTDRSYKTYGKTRKIILSDGSMFEGLPEHKLYCFTDAGLSFVRLDNLAEGTWLPRMIGTELFPTKVPNIDGHGPLSVGMCKLLGYLIAEGHVTSTTCSFTNYDPEVIAEFKQLLFAEFGSDVPVRETSRTGGKTTGIFINGSAKTLLIGLAGAGLSAHKEIPFVVRCAPAEYQSAFLQALFEGDGWITGGKKARNGSTRYRLAYCTISEQLAYQVKAMLENFGIACKFKQRDTCWATNGTSKQVQKPAYGVKIEHTGAKAFKEFIGFAATRKQALLEDYVEHLYSAKLQNTNL
jgi:hypothetical protein